MAEEYIVHTPAINFPSKPNEMNWTLDDDAWWWWGLIKGSF